MKGENTDPAAQLDLELQNLKETQRVDYLPLLTSHSYAQLQRKIDEFLLTSFEH